LICAGSPSKYSPENDGIFIDIATQKPNCHFVFFDFQNNLTQILHARLKTAFNDANLDSGQFIRLIPSLEKSDFYGLMQKADLYLDTIRLSGFNTAMQAIQCGLPIVTMEGQFMKAMFASRILRTANSINLVTGSNKSYIDNTIKLVSDKSIMTFYKKYFETSKTKSFDNIEPIKYLDSFMEQLGNMERPI
jgi:predicted O-linked N-acetylglucosamine transferase (SPINDLY family)